MIWGAVLALLALAAPQAERVTLTGRVFRLVGRDTVGAPGAKVLLHRVMPSRQGPIDSVISGPDGTFRFKFHPEGGALYLTSARWAGIEYFAPPIVNDRRTPAEFVLLAVADTSSKAPVVLASRHLVIGAPAADGTRSVIELLMLDNRGPDTRVGHDSTAATWIAVLPPGIARVQLGDTDFATDVVELQGDTLRVRAPLPPGQRQITVQYQLPAGIRRWAIPVDDSVAAMNLLIEESTAKVSGPLRSGAVETIEGRRYLRWQGAAPRAAVVAIAFEQTGVPDWVLPLLVALLATGLVAAWLVVRRRGGPSPTTRVVGESRPSLAPETEALLARIAALDAEHSGGPSRHSPEIWHRYLRTRAQLKQDVERLLLR
jgi:hypothetical protein